MSKKITIVKIRKIREENINDELQWLGNSLGLFNLRDKDSSCFRIFITLVRKSKRNEIISSDDIAERLSLTRGTVVHHLTKLMESGIVIREKKGYLLRENRLHNIIKNIKRDLENIFEELEDVAKDIDQKLG
ncbi:MAG: HTH domain-containing protein [Nanoarchaeota archaeon]|nr:helix-turn-helix domain-containing protein [Nanoarchaeota archaeon]MBU1632325.1 helix-turn-helix domain-containing protein [Nanoarchaeota archaeon]MBU1875884.1 helix-turn-helix domain-containing protein [Nanoarchaeota archaeon]